MSRRKILLFTIIALLAAFFLIYVLFFHKPSATVLKAMPDDVLCFFDVQDEAAFGKLTTDNKAFSELATTRFFGSLKSDLEQFYTICSSHVDLFADVQNEEFLCGAFNSGNQEVDYLFLLQLNDAKRLNVKDIRPELDHEKPAVSSHVFEGTDIYELYYPKHHMKVSFAKLADIFIFSGSSVFVENSILQLKNGNPVTNHAGFKEVAAEMDNDVDFNLYLNIEQLTDYFSMFTSAEKYDHVMRLKQFASWIGIHPTFTDEGIVLSGYASAKSDSVELNLQQYQGDFAINMNPAVPEGAVMLYRINAEHLTKNIGDRITESRLNREYFDHWSPWMDEQLLVGVSESLDKNFMRRSFIIFPATDVQLAASKIRYGIISDTTQYRGHAIMQLNCGEVAGKIAGIQFPDSCFGSWYANGLMLAQEKIQMQNMIDAIENHATLSNDIDYNEFKKQLSASFNNSLYLDLSKCEQILKGFISDKHIDTLAQHFGLLQHFSSMEIQFSENKGVFLVNGFIKYSATPQRKSGMLWKQEVDCPVESGPFTVTAISGNEKNIIIQDTLHQVYMLSPSGEVIWKLPFPEKITGSVYEVDFYGNEGQQLLFNTAHQIHLIDMSGNPVEGFPIELTAMITNPLTVLMNTKNDYRMFVACENDNIYGFYKDGKPIPGWSPMRGAGTVLQRLFTFDNGKDHYIAYLNQKGVQIKRDDGINARSIAYKDSVVATLFRGPVKYIMGEEGDVLAIDNELNTTEIDEPDDFVSGGFARMENRDTASILWMDDVYFKAIDLREETLFTSEQGYASGKVIVLTFGNQDYFGVVTDDYQIRLLDATGKIIEGFPVKASAHCVIDDLTMSGDKMLITVVGSMVITYRIK